jgi:hypothetical protein
MHCLLGDRYGIAAYGQCQRNSSGGERFNIDIVVAHAVPGDHFKLLGRSNDPWCDSSSAHQQAMGFLHCLAQIFF